MLSDDPATRDAALRQQRLGKTLVDFLNADAAPPQGAPGVGRAAEAGPAHDGARRSGKAARADGEPPLACPSGLSPTRPSPSTFPKLKRYFGGEPYFDAIADAHIDLIALAFACDVTRFATLYLGDLSYEGNPLGLPADNHGSVAHTYDGSPVGTNGNPMGTTSGTPSTWALLATFNRYAYGKVARMMDKLTDYGVVDSTLVYASSDMGNPALHSTRNVPTVLGGGVNGKFRMGRRLKAPADCPSIQPRLQAGRCRVQRDRQQPPAGLDRARLRRGDRQLRLAAKRRRQERPAGRPDLTRAGRRRPTTIV